MRGSEAWMEEEAILLSGRTGENSGPVAGTRTDARSFTMGSYPVRIKPCRALIGRVIYACRSSPVQLSFSPRLHRPRKLIFIR